MDLITRRRAISGLLKKLLGSVAVMVFAPFLRCREKEGGIFSMNRPLSKKTSGRRAYRPGYLRLHEKGELKRRGEELWEVMRSCRLCPRGCGVNRLKGREGFCRSSSKLEVSSYSPHHGEERPLAGTHGSGTIFLTNCGLRCVFCINWQINHAGYGEVVSIERMADMMLDLQKRGCHNINMVTPTHYSPHIVFAIDRAVAKGLRIPLVYNTSGFEREWIIRKLDGIVDIYLPDFKYSSGKMADRYSPGAVTYPEMAKLSIKEMHRQVGAAYPADDGLMKRGLMIRHLVMPNDVGGSLGVVKWIAENLPKDTYLNIMSQYRPAYRAMEFPKISRGITRREYSRVVDYAKKAGLTNLDIQGQAFL
jgi:putative pyruvate formate lyase activating enzyme